MDFNKEYSEKFNELRKNTGQTAWKNEIMDVGKLLKERKASCDFGSVYCKGCTFSGREDGMTCRALQTSDPVVFASIAASLERRTKMEGEG